jgi:hypothetical protein
MGLNMEALEKAQEDLKKRSSGSKNWIQAAKLDAPLDFRIMDPTGAMGGLYYQEVMVWWINGTRVISPKTMGSQEQDIIQLAIDEAKAAKVPDVLKLLNAKGDKGPKVQFRSEFWIPVLKFNWQTDKQGAIIGITDKAGAFDPALIKNFIDDGEWKILVVGISALKGINEIATKRGGALMTDPTKGFNLILSKSGTGKETKYSVVKDEVYPMPLELYVPEKLVDPYELAQSLMYTEDYMNSIIGKYLYNEDCPDKDDSCYAYPEIREKFKSLLTDSAEEPAPKRERPGASRPAAPAATTTEEALVATPRGGRPAAPATTGRPAAGRPAATGKPAGRPGRNVADDLKDV